MLDFLENLDPLYLFAATVFSWIISAHFCWIASQSRQNDNKGSYGTNEVKTHHCNGCSQEVSKIAFQCCTECMVDLLKALDQHFTVEDADDDTMKIKVAIAKGEDQ